MRWQHQWNVMFLLKAQASRTQLRLLLLPLDLPERGSLSGPLLGRIATTDCRAFLCRQAGRQVSVLGEAGRATPHGYKQDGGRRGGARGASFHSPDGTTRPDSEDKF